MYELSKREALREARIALRETYGCDLNATDVVSAVKDLGINVFEKALKEIRTFNENIDRRLVEASDASQMGNIMADARVQFNWENPLLDYMIVPED